MRFKTWHSLQDNYFLCMLTSAIYDPDMITWLVIMINYTACIFLLQDVSGNSTFNRFAITQASLIGPFFILTACLIIVSMSIVYHVMKAYQKSVLGYMYKSKLIHVPM